ncbi:MAG: PIG-L deacetylase family protein [Pseudomonadota bacterium]|uniref:PIG-L deacetylase family protein n=1 Tax=Thermithiobacillus tepidarius TaxID=929 RepID=UPI00041259DE|nr:PIG-L family deacetylase [Thermithiobacillus tepidarius]
MPTGKRELVIAPHPDDEALGLGAYLRERRPAAVVFLTDGVPRDSRFFAKTVAEMTPEAYRAVRRQEAQAAAAHYGLDPAALFFLDVPDMEAFRELAQLERALGAIVDAVRPEVIWSPAYEGGHPDHDAAAFLAARQAARSGAAHWEYALYHFHHGMQQLSFLGRDPGIPRPLSLSEMAYKKELLALYASQSSTLGMFRTNVERYRRAPAYDFSRRPVAGRTLYETWGWPITGDMLARAFADFQNGIAPAAALGGARVVPLH